MSHGIEKQEDVLKKSGRSWLHNAAMAVTSAVMLFFVLAGCTKEQWDHLGKTPHPGGGLGSTRDQWYALKVTYNNSEEGRQKDGYMNRRLYEGSWSRYMEVDEHRVLGQSRFKLHPAGDGWAYWETDDGTWLSLSYYGWLYSSEDSTSRVAWKIVDGKLYNLSWNKANWQNYPAGSQRRYSDWEFGEYAYFVGMDLGEDYVLTNCELVPIW